MPTQRTPVSFVFQGCQGRKVTAAFNGGAITSHAEALLLREIGRDGGLFDRVAACFADHRDPRRTEHSVSTLVAQCIVALALGYEDLNDHDYLRHDPVTGLFADKTGGTRKDCAVPPGRSESLRSPGRPRRPPGKSRTRSGTGGHRRRLRHSTAPHPPRTARSPHSIPCGNLAVSAPAPQSQVAEAL